MFRWLTKIKENFVFYIGLVQDDDMGEIILKIVSDPSATHHEEYLLSSRQKILVPTDYSMTVQSTCMRKTSILFLRRGDVLQWGSEFKKRLT